MARIKEYIYLLLRQEKHPDGGRPWVDVLSVHYEEDVATSLKNYYKGSEGKGVIFKIKKMELVQ